MCNPTLLAVASVVTTVAQGYMAKQQAKQQAEYEDGVARYNVRQQENEAQRITNKGVEEENEQRRRVLETMSSQRAQFGASGVDPLTGSALQVQEDTLLLGEVDALRVRKSYQEQAESLMEQSELTLYEGKARAGLTRQRGRNAFTGALLTAGGEFAGSGVADKWFTPRSAAVVSSRGSHPLIPGGGGAPVYESV